MIAAQGSTKRRFLRAGMGESYLNSPPAGAAPPVSISDIRHFSFAQACNNARIDQGILP
jgi:hypothetical protein